MKIKLKMVLMILFCFSINVVAQDKLKVSGIYYGLNKDYGEYVYFYKNNFYYNVNLGEFFSYVQGVFEIKKNNELYCYIKEKGFGEGWAENDITNIKIIIQQDQTLKFITKFGYDISDNKIFQLQKIVIKKVKVNLLNLRANYNMKSKIIKNLKKGEPIIIISLIAEDTINSIKGHWVFIKTENDDFGYCFDGYLE